jgi:uncharacterized membrane protein YvlD (DUF360 family)
LLLLLLGHKATEPWNADGHALAMQALAAWMFVSKFIKLLGHYVRYPVDVLLLPVSILFGYFHGVIKIYAVLTLNVVCYIISLGSFRFIRGYGASLDTTGLGLCRRSALTLASLLLSTRLP